jgi:2'-5' RNA ligase
LRSHALEYLDNTLSGEVRRSVFAVIDDQPLDEKLRLAERHFGVSSSTKVAALDKMLAEPASGDSEECHLTLAALYAVHQGRIEELHNRVQTLVAEATNPFVGETARWVAVREGLSV